MDIAKLKELLGAATPGPWDCDVFRGEDVSLESHGIELGMMFAGKNAALIVAAVNALPSLLARLEAAERLVAEFRKAAKAHEIKADRNGLDDAWQAWHMGASEMAGDCADLLATALTTYDQEKARG